MVLHGFDVPSKTLCDDAGLTHTSQDILSFSKRLLSPSHEDLLFTSLDLSSDLVLASIEFLWENDRYI